MCERVQEPGWVPRSSVECWLLRVNTKLLKWSEIKDSPSWSVSLGSVRRVWECVVFLFESQHYLSHLKTELSASPRMTPEFPSLGTKRADDDATAGNSQSAAVFTRSAFPCAQLTGCMATRRPITEALLIGRTGLWSDQLSCQLPAAVYREPTRVEVVGVQQEEEEEVEEEGASWLMDWGQLRTCSLTADVKK